MSDQRTILIVDDDVSARYALKRVLETAGYATVEATYQQVALSGVRELALDAILLDIASPDLSGLGLVREFREQTRAPIVTISSVEDVRVKILALDAGADDYLCKPLSIDELCARLRAILRRSSQMMTAPGPTLRRGLLKLDLDKMVAMLAGSQIQLTPRELVIFKVLMRKCGAAVTHQELLQAVWGPAYTKGNHLLRVNICNLRRKLEGFGPASCSILSVPGVGYKLESDTTEGT